MLRTVVSRDARHQAALAGAAVAGAVVGHDLTYLLTVPDPHARAALLGETGHGYWFAAVATAVVLGGVALGLTLVRHFRVGWQGRTATSGRRVLPVTQRLACMQVAIFVVQELTERLIVGAPLAGMLQHEMAAGIAVQIIVAFAGAVLLALVARSAEAVGRALHRSTPAPQRAGYQRRWQVRGPHVGLVAGSVRSRAPPPMAV